MNNKRMDWESFWVGFMFALFCVTFVVIWIPNSNLNLYREAIVQCEKDLPRSKHCKVIGVVDESVTFH